jgi:hypothetical protein
MYLPLVVLYGDKYEVSVVTKKKVEEEKQANI